MKKLILTTFAIAAIAFQSKSQVFYRFNGGSPAPIDSIPTLTASDVKVVNSAATNQAFIDNSDPNPLSRNSSNGFYGQASAKNIPLNSENSTYLEATFTPVDSNSVSISGISFFAKGGGPNGPKNWVLRSSFDNYAATLATGSFASDMNGQSVWRYESSVSTPVVQTPGASVTFRLYAYNFTGTPNPDSINVKIDDLTFYPDGFVLPINLKSFYAKEINGEVLLDWTTASEKSNAYFNVLRSSDGKSFSAVKEGIKGAGDSDTEISYSFVDINPLAGTSYYKLQQVDFDGKFSYSQIKVVKTLIAESSVKVYATTSTVTAMINSNNNTKAKVSLFDIMGRNLGTQEIILNKGQNNVTFEKSLTRGIHILNVVTETETFNTKFATN